VKEAFTGQGLFVVGLFLGALALASVFACLACFVVQKNNWLRPQAAPTLRELMNLPVRRFVSLAWEGILTGRPEGIRGVAIFF
jgi:hypothetical protein